MNVYFFSSSSSSSSSSFFFFFLDSINVWHDPPPHQVTVLLPISTILLVAGMVIATLTMDQQNGKIDGEEVGDHRVKATWQTVSKTHQPVTKVVDVTSSTPPP